MCPRSMRARQGRSPLPRRTSGPYGQRVDRELRETHSAVVAMVGDRAYKVKKPVRLPFLDFSTVGARRAVAEREVALNRRLAPDVYLGAPIPSRSS